MFGLFRKEKSDQKLISVTKMMGDRMKEEIIKGNNFKPITITFDPTEYGHLVGYLCAKTGIEL